MSADDAQRPDLLAIVRLEARRIAQRIPEGGPTLQDLIGMGAIGLAEAQARFDPRRGVHFETFARHRVRGAIFDGLRAQGIFGRRAWEDLRRQSLAHEVIEEPTTDPPGGPDRARDALAVATAIGQLATAFLAEAALASTPPPDAEALLVDRQAAERLREAVRRLDSGDREVVQAVYDLGDTGDSGTRLAERRGVTKAAISRRHRLILDRLRRLMGVDHE